MSTTAPPAPPPHSPYPAPEEPGPLRRWLAPETGGAITSIITTILAFLIGGVVVAATGHNPLTTYQGIFNGTGLNWLFPWVTGSERAGEGCVDPRFARLVRGQADRRHTRAGSPAALGEQLVAAPDRQRQPMAELEEDDVARNLEVRRPAEPVDVEAARRLEVGDAERDEVQVLVHAPTLARSTDSAVVDKTTA